MCGSIHTILQRCGALLHEGAAVRSDALSEETLVKLLWLQRSKGVWRKRHCGMLCNRQQKNQCWVDDGVTLFFVLCSGVGSGTTACLYTIPSCCAAPNFTEWAALLNLRSRSRSYLSYVGCGTPVISPSEYKTHIVWFGCASCSCESTA